jgi:hypothetical protein
VLDAMTFEKLGIPAVAVITEPFVPTAESIARLAGMPGYAVAVLPHPFGSLGEAEVAAHAERIVQRIEALLLDAGAERGLQHLAGRAAG